MRRLFLAAVLWLASVPAFGQNICPTAPFGTNNNQCASTAFVQDALSGGSLAIVVGSTPITGGTSGRVLYDNAGVLGEYPVTGTAGNVVLSASPTVTGTLNAATILATGNVTAAALIPSGSSVPTNGMYLSAPNQLNFSTDSTDRLFLTTSTFGSSTSGGGAMPLAAASATSPTFTPNRSGTTTGIGAQAPGNMSMIVIGSEVGRWTGTGLDAVGLSISGVPVTTGGITALTGDVTATGPGSVAATLATNQPGAHTWALGQTFSSAMTYGGVTLANSVTGTGSMVLATSPSVSGLTVTGSFTATGLVGNASLANDSTEVNGQTCTLGSTCTITATAADIEVGVTTVSSGNDTRVLFNNAGVLGQYVISGTGNVAMTTSPAFTTPDLGTPSAATLTNATGLPISTGVSGLGTGVATALAVNTGSAGAVVLFDGALGTPSSGTLTNASGLPISTGVSGLGTNVATALAVNVGTAGAFVVNGGALGTPSSGTLTNATGLPVASGISGLGTGVATALAVNVGTTGSFSRLIASGAKALATGAISSATCTSAQTDTATGTLTTDAVIVSFNADPTAVTGYVPLTTGMLTIIYYPTADTVNFKVCNNTASSITPGAITINWRVLR